MLTIFGVIAEFERELLLQRGSNTAGTNKLTIMDIGKLTPEEVTVKVRYIVSGTKRGYRPKMWTLGIRDKHFLGKILRTLKAPIKMPNGQLEYPTKGTPTRRNHFVAFSKYRAK